MPTAPPHVCSQYGCRELIPRGQGRCKVHARQERQDYDRGRGTAAERGYDARWRKYRLAYLRCHPLCVACLGLGRVAAATQIDHTQPVQGPDDPLFWQESNHQALCELCHSKKTIAESGWNKGKNKQRSASP